ncbi:MAG: amidohydrolase family protein [Candidatus Hadarchaeales archaeon]
MADLLIENGLVLTMNKEGTIIKNGFVLIEDGKISQIGKGSIKLKADEIIDARGKIVMPGFVCAHTHFSRILAQGTSLGNSNIFRMKNLWHKIDESLSKNELWTCVSASCLQYLHNGVTFVAGVLPGSNPSAGILGRILSKIQEIGIRVGLSVLADEQHGKLKGAHGMRENEKLIKKIRKKRHQNVVGFVSVKLDPSTSEELLKYGKEISQRYRVPFLLHSEDSRLLREVSYQKYGENPLIKLFELGVLRQGTILAHCIPINGEELKLLKNNETKLGYTIADVSEAIRLEWIVSENVPVSLGDDGLLPDLLGLLKTVYLMTKLSSLGLTLKTSQLLEMATKNGAEMYGVNTGILEKGKAADIVILDHSHMPAPLRPAWITDQIVGNFDGRFVDTVIVDGRIVKRDGKVLSIDEEKTIEEYQKIAEEVWDRVGGG